ncbi:unnamed protein product [Vitrella brassicaformis CCMP3155]|uniref:Peptidase C1A papain C-terminal domain-containing protein n=2 Tax=Vitrella brassicaformis TaxID=1169539 RepID=A0A0G4ES01_VITBC|nr:unnamed protein product [Vitrella brassicaformis CCMP3155]|mmetsp:Transcript_41484/g.117764  ORF Transcript_41484/g.117764 Transcript_41484/m.117764 type:complete len:185 (+) Transcript_41484:29-583(+)|eukprot:CEM00640.1 unnamed protein product [Vitrella brassicaformis CCMP3155]
MSRLRPPEDLPVSYDCHSSCHLALGGVIHEPVDQQNRNTCWLHAAATAFKCKAVLSGCRVEDISELNCLCSEERLLRLCGVSAQAGGDPAHALECLTGTPPSRLGHGLEPYERVKEICRWMMREGPVVVASFRPPDDFIGSSTQPYDCRSGRTTFRDGNSPHAVVSYGWRKTEHGIWVWRVKNS